MTQDKSNEWDFAHAQTKGVRDALAETEAELQIMRTAGIIEVAVRNPSVMEYIKHWECRAEAAEATLAAKDAEIARLRELVERAQDLLDPCYPQSHWNWQDDASAVLKDTP